ncbi:DUF6197 family protein [Streptomyces sp. BBFR102]|uniref:DUF6197 family protein n=1 Tax=Streptomyces sp. BBFR102 TaxID=3448171 RepID=UPI003F52D248
MTLSHAPSPDALDEEAARLHESAVWQELVASWPVTAAPGARPDGTPAPGPGASSPRQDLAASQEEWRALLSVPVSELVARAARALPAPDPAAGSPLPGRVQAVLPDRLYGWRRAGRSEVLPSVHMAYARRVLVEWGWQNRPYRLRNLRGARCLCGALLTAHRLGHGSLDTANRSAAWLMTELRARGWRDLIGPWNRAPGRTAGEALELLDAARARARRAGE